MEKLTQHIKRKASAIWAPDNPSSDGFERQGSWFDMREMHNKQTIKPKLRVIRGANDVDGQMKCIKIDIFPNDEQRAILMRWLYAYAHMYNATIAHLRNNDADLNWHNIRTNVLKLERKRILVESHLDGMSRCTFIQAHTLDGAIKTACANWKTARANQRAGRIKFFRIRNWRVGRRQLVMDMEPQCFKSGTLCPRVFGQDMTFMRDDVAFDVSAITSECKILYDRLYDKFTLLVPQKCVREMKAPQYDETIALDPGIRMFLTGISENNSIELGSDVCSRLIDIFRVMDNAQSKITSKKRLNKVLRRCRRKIAGLVTELHWKCAKILTDRYDTIAIGDFSAKRVSNRDQSVLSSMIKRVALALSFYKFRERLQFKCAQKGRKFILVDEHYTSKLCSFCGHNKTNLGAASVYECTHCHAHIGRDFNGARNILIRATYRS